jgi:hypothetical protein
MEATRSWQPTQRIGRTASVPAGPGLRDDRYQEQKACGGPSVGPSSEAAMLQPGQCARQPDRSLTHAKNSPASEAGPSRRRPAPVPECHLHSGGRTWTILSYSSDAPVGLERRSPTPIPRTARDCVHGTRDRTTRKGDRAHTPNLPSVGPDRISDDPSSGTGSPACGSTLEQVGEPGSVTLRHLKVPGRQARSRLDDVLAETPSEHSLDTTGFLIRCST